MKNSTNNPDATPSRVTIQASQDAQTGQVYVPPRALAADGSLRPTQPLEISGAGVLYSATTFSGQVYGIVDLDGGARVQALLDGGSYTIGQRVVAVVSTAEKGLRFAHA